MGGEGSVEQDAGSAVAGQQLALDACARHNLGRCTDAFLDRNDSSDLTRPDLEGAPIASRRGR